MKFTQNELEKRVHNLDKENVESKRKGQRGL